MNLKRNTNATYDLEFNYENCCKALEDLNNDYTYGSKYGEYKIIKSCLKNYPSNTDSDIVAMKICLIDTTNSTQIFKQKSKANLNDLVKAILNIKDIDKRIENSDNNLVDELANSTDVHFLSISSKYCFYHNLFCYEKYNYLKIDNIVLNTFPHYYEKILNKKIYKSNTLKRKGYKYCKEKIDELINTDNKLANQNNKYELFDAFMWYKHRNLKWDDNQKKFIKKNN